MSEPMTDETLAAYERDVDTDVGILGEGRDQFRLRRLIQEVRRLREELTRAHRSLAAALDRADEGQQHFKDLGEAIAVMHKAEAERDCYRKAIEDALNHGVPQPSWEILRTALDQQEES